MEPPSDFYTIQISTDFININTDIILYLSISIILMLILLLSSALISGSEVAYFSINKHKVNELKKSDNKDNHKIVKHLEEPKRLLATILVSNNFVNIAIVILSTYITSLFFDTSESGLWIVYFIQIVVITFLLLLFGEVIPKVYATQKPIKLAQFMSSPLIFLNKLFYPICSILMYSTSAIDKRLAKKSATISVDELSHALEITRDEDSDETEDDILKRIVKFGDIEVTEIMKSRVDIFAFDYDTSFEELINNINSKGFSRVPIFKKDLDNVAGILYTKDLLPYTEREKDFSWQYLIRKAYFVPESKKIDDLLKEFQKKKTHLAVVVDEYGGTSGIVTLEDIIEEIVGEIDENSEDKSLYTKISDNQYIFEGKTLINDFCRIIDIDSDYFDKVKGDSDSLAGLFLEISGDIPEINKEISYKNYTFKIEAIEKRRITKINVKIKEEE